MDFHKLTLTGNTDDAGELERFWQRMAPLDCPVAVRLRALAGELAKRPELTVAAVAYRQESVELEVMLRTDPLGEPVRLGQDGADGHCQVSWERWIDISDTPGLTGAVRMVIAVLTSYAVSA